MIYVTHDQTEALTFADKVVVMYDGAVVQIGTPDELFERPRPHLRRPLHRLARHERPAGRGRRRDGAGRRRMRSHLRSAPIRHLPDDTAIELGIRPEFVQLRPKGAGVPVQVEAHRGSRAATHRPGRARRPAARGKRRRRRSPSRAARRRLAFDPSSMHVYADGRLVDGRGADAMDKTVNQQGLVSGPAGLRARGVLGRHSADDGRELLGAGHASATTSSSGRHRLVPGAAGPDERARRALLRLALAQPPVLGHHPR